MLWRCSGMIWRLAVEHILGLSLTLVQQRMQLALIRYMTGGFQYQVCCSDLPVFKLGNGHRDQAVLRVDLLNTSLGQVSFYVLGGTGRMTPPLLGARTLRSNQKHFDFIWQWCVPTSHWCSWRSCRTNAGIAVSATSPSTWLRSLWSSTSPMSFKPSGSKGWISRACLGVQMFPMRHSTVMNQRLNASTWWRQKLNHPCVPCSSWPEGWRIFKEPLKNENVAQKLEAAACDDPRINCYPCYQAHKPGNHRDNQHASWVTCTRCGLRLQYFTKKGRDGSFRQMGPEPHLIRLASKELEQTVDASMVTSNIVTGKTMEINGKMLQMRVSTPVAINMTYPEYKTSVTKWHLWRINPAGVGSGHDCPNRGISNEGPKEDGGSQEEWKRTWTCSEGREDIPGEVSIDCRSDGNRFERRGGHRGEEERNRGVIWAALRDLRNRMSRKGTSDGAGRDHSMVHTSQNPQNQNENVTTITADSGQLFSSQVDINPQSTCTCTTDGTVCSISRQANLWNARLPTQGPNNKVGSNLAVKSSRNAALIGAMVLAPVSGLLGQLQGVPDFVEIACAPKTSSASAFEDKGYFIKQERNQHFEAGADYAYSKGGMDQFGMRKVESFGESHSTVRCWVGSFWETTRSWPSTSRWSEWRNLHRVGERWRFWLGMAN